METLKLVIDLMIQQAGGREKLAHDIECEWGKLFYKNNNHYTPIELRFILSHYDICSCKQIAHSLGRSVHGIEGKVKKLRHEALINYRKKVVNVSKV